MPLPIGPAAKEKAAHLIHSNWRPDTVARELRSDGIRCGVRTVYSWAERSQMYRTIGPLPHALPPGRPRRITTAAKNALLEYQRRKPWAYQDELAVFLEEEWGICVSQPTGCRLLKENGISRKKGQRVGNTQSQVLRDDWQAFMVDVKAEQLVFLDESIFKQQTGWRCMAYAPIGQPARWCDDLTRGATWSISPAYTVDGYLPCTSIREGYFNQETFLDWVQNDLLPHCNPYPGPRSIIYLDNVSIYLDPRIQQVVEEAGLMIKFLPPYSSDYSPIELSFSVLKAWMRRHWRRLWPLFQGDFGGLLRYAIDHSQCDQFARQHFKHAAGGYIFEGDYEALEHDLDAWSWEEM